jgi:hypothetical protein
MANADMPTQRRIWTLLKERGPMKPADVRAELGLSETAVATAVKKMVRKRCIERIGATRSMQWKAAKQLYYKRRSPPQNEAQEAGLKRGQQIGLRKISLMRWGKPFVPRAKHPLDRAWGLIPAARAQHQEAA